MRDHTMNDRILAFLQAAQTQSDLAKQIHAIYGEVADLVATRLSQLSQETPHPLSPQDVLGAPIGDAQLSEASGGASAMDFLKNFSHQVDQIRRIQAGELD